MLDVDLGADSAFELDMLSLITSRDQPQSCFIKISRRGQDDADSLPQPGKPIDLNSHVALLTFIDINIAKTVIRLKPWLLAHLARSCHYNTRCMTENDVSDSIAAMTSTRAPFPRDIATFAQDSRIYLDPISKSYHLKDENGEEWDWSEEAKGWQTRVSSRTKYSIVADCADR